MEELLNDTCHDGKMNLSNIDNIKNHFFQETNINGDDSFLKKIKTGNVIIQYATLDEQKNANDKETSSIDLGDCEKTLRDVNNIDQSKSLIVYKVDVKNSDSSSTYVKLEVYNPDDMVNQLDLSVCDKITINSPVELGKDIEDKYDSLSESGYNLFDSEDSFYNDICTTYTTSDGTDMILADRKTDIYSSVSDITLCQTGCTFESYNSKTKKASCNCDTSSSQVNSLSNIDIDSLFDKNELKNNFYDTLSNSNFRVLKCYKSVFSSKFWKNAGGIFMAVLGIAFLASHIFSYILYQSMINSYIIEIINLNEGNSIPNNKNQIDLNEKENNNENNKEDNEKKKKRKKRKKRKKKKKKVEENQFPPKKRKKSKNKNEETNKKGIESINNNILNENNIKFDKSKKDSKNEIIVYTNDKIISNEKNNISPKMEKEVTLEEKPLDINKLTDQEINNLKYEDALIIDKRTYFEYYWSLLKKKHLILFTFWPQNDFNLFAIKVSLFLLSFGLYFTINGFFFSDDSMHKLYEDKGKYNIVYRIPQILFSTIISAVINVLLKQLSLTEANILSIKQEKDNKKMLEKSKSIKKCLRIKFIIYFVLSIILMAFFWYFITSFCVVYTNTQVVLIKDTLVSYALSMVYPFGLNLLPGFFRIPALRAEKGDKSCIYKISLYVALI